MPKAKTSSSTALVVVNDGAVDKSKLARLQAGALDLLAQIDGAEAENVRRRIVVGLALVCIKATLKHGEWMPWVRKNMKSARQRQ